MVFTIFAVAAVSGLMGVVFFGLVADAYLHMPVSTEVKVRHSKRSGPR